jgi:hypothetical protein
MIVSDDRRPKVELAPGMKLHVGSTMLVGPDLKRIKNIAARLCAGGGTCMALIDIGGDVINPPTRARTSTPSRSREPIGAGTCTGWSRRV